MATVLGVRSIQPDGCTDLRSARTSSSFTHPASHAAWPDSKRRTPIRRRGRFVGAPAVILARGLRGLVVVFWATWEAVAVLWEATRDCEAVAPVDEGAA